MIYVLSFWSDVAFSIKQALRTFSCTIAAIIYNFIVDLYNVFMYTHVQRYSKVVLFKEYITKLE